MKIQTPPGMRDFYPEDMRRQNWLFDQWRRASRAAGFCEFDGPIFEFLELYKAKSGDEIVGQLFSFEDRGGREFAIRPEITPTLARMVAARANALPRPIKWFSMPRMCRAERPQRGRLREFYQWNVDVLGVDDPLADAEVIAVAAALLRNIGLSAADVAIKISSRALAAAVLQSVAVPADRSGKAFELLDASEKLPPEKFAAAWSAEFPQAAGGVEVLKLLTETSFEDTLALAERSDATAGASVAETFRALWRHLRALGVEEYCEFDLRTVRGLAYYTGTVFEGRDRAGKLRAILGGGRYDNLTQLFGGPAVPAVGFGSGDAPTFEYLAEYGQTPATDDALDVFVIDADAELFSAALDLVGRLRQAGLAVDFSYKRQNVGKQFKQAAARRASHAVIVGEAFSVRREVEVKNLATGEQRGVSLDALLADPAGMLAG